jgi:hypothetical protein
MNRKLIHDQIDSFLESLREQHAILKGRDRIPAIELDLMMEELRKFYDCCRMLEKNISQPPVKEMPPATGSSSEDQTLASVPTLKESPPVVKPAGTQKPPVVEDSIFFDSAGKDKGTAEQTEEDRVRNTLREPSVDLGGKKEIEEPLVVSSQLEIPMTAENKDFEIRRSSDERSGFSPLGEKFREEPSLYDKLSKGAEDRTLANKLKKNPIPDLKSAIGINEKFLFINQLFNGDAMEYTNAIDYINKSGDHSSALRYLKENVFGKYSWTEDNDQVQIFLDLVERRFL